MFRYSGNKNRLIKHIPQPLIGTTTIIEPFGGSLAYSAHYKPAAVWAAESNPLVRSLLEWLRTEATSDDLTRLEGLKPSEKIDAMAWGVKHGLKEPEVTLTRLQISGAYVGQLSSRVLYPQHSLNLTALKERLPYVKDSLREVQSDFRSPAIRMAAEGRGTMCFVDPPYLNTSGNYKSKGADHGGLDVAAITAFVKSLPCPVLFTYGDGAQTTFPDLEWTKAVTRRVPILRGGGTRERTEWYTTLNWS